MVYRFGDFADLSRRFLSQKTGPLGISQPLPEELNYDRVNAACLARSQFDVTSAAKGL